MQMPLEPTTGEKSGIFSNDIMDQNDMGPIFNSNNIFNRKDIRWYDRFNRFGVIDPYNAVTNTKEYLFFTKPDLHIFQPGTTNLNPELENSSFFNELVERYPDVAKQLQKSVRVEKSSDYYPFMNILSNSVKNTLDMPEVSSDDIETATNIYGTTITYRGDGWSSDEAYEFSLEFEDTRYLEVYQLFKAYDEYEKLKRVGIVSPPNIDGVTETDGVAYTRYHRYKELHDQFGVYKIVTDEDYETILYYAYFCGVYPKTVPRDSFSDVRTDNGLRHTVTFRAQFVDDMKPYILTFLNTLVSESMLLSEDPEFIDVYDTENKRIDGRWALCPWITRRYKSSASQWLGPNSMKYDYKLRWRAN